MDGYIVVGIGYIEKVPKAGSGIRLVLDDGEALTIPVAIAKCNRELVVAQVNAFFDALEKEFAHADVRVSE